MSGFFGRVAERALGNDAQLRPVTNRWSISRAPDLPVEISSNEGSVARGFPSQMRDARNDAARSDTALPVILSEAPKARSRRTDGTNRVDAAAVILSEAPKARSQRTDGTNRVDDPVILSETPKARSRRTDGTYGVDRDVAPPDRAPRLIQQQVAPAIAARPAAADAREIVRRAPEPAPVYVHIGRIDVRAVDVPVLKSTPAHSALRRPSLEAHLRTRDRGGT